MRVLITGSRGFLGTHLMEEFNKQKSDDIILLNSSSKKLDLLDPIAVSIYFHDYEPNIIIHAAARVGGIEYNKNNPGILIRDNLLMGINVLDAAIKYKIDNVYIVSTCCSYPKFCPVPFKEDDLWNGMEEETNSSYGVGKKAIIKMSQSYRQQYGLKSTCFILANLFGKHDNFNPNSSHVVPALIKKFLEAKNDNISEVKLFGSGIATRDLLNAKDAAKQIVDAVMSKFDYSEPINLGTGRDISIKDLASLIAELTEYKGKIIFTGEVSDGQLKRRLDVSRAKELLGWEAKTKLRDGLIETINYYKESIINVKK